MKENESINYKILKYLNEHYVRENNHLGNANEIIKAIPDIDYTYIRATLYGLATQNAISKDPNDCYKITVEGEKELNRLQLSVDSDNNKEVFKSLRKSVTANKWATFAISVVTALVAGAQYHSSRTQNQLLHEQNQLIREGQVLESKSLESSQKDPQPQKIEIYVSKGKKIKIDTVKISK
jgi:hypothetical protein